MSLVFAAVGAMAVAQSADDSIPRPRLLEPVSAEAGPASAELVYERVPSHLPAEGATVPAAKLLDPVFPAPKPQASQVIAQPAPPTPPAPDAPGSTQSTAYPDQSRRSRGSRLWVEADYLLWWTRGDRLPPLVTTGPGGGVLGAPGTRVLFGDSTVNDGARSGGVISFGYWFNCEETCGIEASFFMFGNTAADFNGVGNRPFFNAAAGQQDAQSSSHIHIRDNSSGPLGAGAWFRQNLCCNPCSCFPYRLDGLVGFRYLHLADDLTIDETLVTTVANPPVPVGTRLALTDQFLTRNNFYGLDLGLTGEVRYGRWVLSGFGRVALGVTCEEVDINGSTTITVPGGAPVNMPGGFLALQSNIGHYTRSRFAVVPEVGVNLGYQLTERLRLQAGYNLLFWSAVARPGDQIDTTINPNLFPPVAAPVAGPLRPAAHIQDSSFWAQGLTFGILFKF